MEIQYRQAEYRDASPIASLFRRTRKASLPYLPTLHTAEEDVEYFRGRVLTESEVWVAQSGGAIVGFCAFTDTWLGHLYVAPERQRTGIGSKLLQIALSRSRALYLWVFQQNTQAIEFYEKHGFRHVKSTDGAENEERMPDALYLFEPT